MPATARFDGFISYSHAADDLLAPRLQTALQTFAKPWWKRRAVRVFRDQSSLSANPHLWSSITEALDSSQWFILLTSPEAASSQWVDREVAYWLERKGSDRILPVLTDGSLSWDEERGRLAEGSAVPPSLIDAFPGEPRWVDLSWAAEETQLDLRNAGFRGAVADIASSLRGIPKDDLESEEVRQHRRTRRTAWGAGIALAVLAVAAVVGFVIARNNENLARSRELAASAINLLDQDPELSILLGLQAIEASPRATEAVEPLNALREAVHASRLRGRYLASEARGLVWIDLSPDGSRLAVLAEREGTVSLLDTNTLEPLWVYSDPETVDSFIRVNYSPDGSLIAVGVKEPSASFLRIYLPTTPRPGAERDDGLPPRVLLLDATTGRVERTIEFPSCPDQAPTPVFSPDGRWLAVGGLTDCAEAGVGEMLLFDLATFEQTSFHHVGETGLVSWSADGSTLVVGHYDVQATMGTTLIDLSTMEPVVLPNRGALITPDGSRLIADALLTQEVFDLATRATVDILGGLNQIGAARLITEDGGRLIVGTMGQELWVYDLESGEQLMRLGPAGSPNSMACRGSCDTLYQANDTGNVNIWDLSQEAGGEVNTSSTGFFVNSEGVHATEQIGVFFGINLAEDRAWAVPFDPATGRLHSGRRATDINNPTALPDGRIVLAESSGTSPEIGPVVAWDPETDQVEKVFGCWTTVEMMEQYEFGLLGDPPCTDTEGSYFSIDTIHLSPNRQSFVVSNSTGQVRIFDSATLEEIAGLQLPPDHVTVLAYGGSWLVSKDLETAYVVSVDGGNVLATLGPASARHFAAVSSDSRLLALTFIGGQVRIYDSATWELVSTFDTKTTTRGHAISPDGSMLMTASSDGYVRVWDMGSGEELARIPVPDPSDGHWL
ncbi:MAG TPA: TIR domain-containing protein, partial [Acidimicrobiia bacterium]|nr:TIR domain-containing protein [Acidimicrobiia bacterium]